MKGHRTCGDQGIRLFQRDLERGGGHEPTLWASEIFWHTGGGGAPQSPLILGRHRRA